MFTIDELLDRARERTGSKSDRALAKILGVNNTAVSWWRTKRAWPADDTMMKLASLAEVDEAEALIALCQWRTTGPTRKVYDRIASQIALACLALAFIAGQAVMPGNQAEAAQSVPGKAPSVYIMENINTCSHDEYRRLAP